MFNELDAFRKNEDEATQDYIDRVCAIRTDYKLTWEDLADIINAACDLNYSESYYRKHYVNKMREALAREDVAQVIEEKPIDYKTQQINELNDLLFKVQKERVKLSDERIQRNADVRQLSREETIKEIAENFAKTMNKEKLLSTNIPDFYTGNKAAILEISDWHYGIEINNYWNQYNTEIARQRISNLLKQVIETCKQNDVKEIHVVNLSDLICGRIHLPLRLQSRIDVITQIMEVSEILAEFLTSLSETMKVHYYDCLDNHSRIEPNKKNAVDLESFVRITTWYLKERVGDYVSIHENMFGEDIIFFNIKGFNIAGVHGDHDKPQQVVDNLSLMTHRNFDLILTAHRHHFSCDEKNEILVVSNGSLMGTDEYAKDLRLSSTPSQNLILVGDFNVAECIYRIIVN